MSLTDTVSPHLRFQVAATLATSLGIAASLVGASAILRSQYRSLGFSQRAALQISFGSIFAAALISTLGVGIALFLRSRVEAEAPESRPPWTAGNSIHQQALSTEISISQYQRLALQQARAAFRQSQRAMIVALLVLSGGAVAILVAATIERQLLFGAFTLLGSGFSAFLSKTFLDLFRQSIVQLNHSHHVPVVKNLALLASSIACAEDGLKNRDLALNHIVSALLRAMSSFPVTSLVIPESAAREDPSEQPLPESAKTEGDR